MAHSILIQIVRFSAVGTVATGLQYALLAVFVEWFFIEPVTASATAFSISALVNYGLNRRFTFSTSSSHVQALPRFAVVAFTGLGVNTGVMVIAYSYFAVHYFVAQVLATAVVLFFTFAGNRWWTFR